MDECAPPPHYQPNLIAYQPDLITGEPAGWVLVMVFTSTGDTELVRLTLDQIRGLADGFAEMVLRHDLDRAATDLADTPPRGDTPLPADAPPGPDDETMSSAGPWSAV